MAVPKFLLKKSTYIVLAILVAGGVWFSYSRSKSRTLSYETTPVVRQDLQQTIEVTGEIKPAARI